MTSETDGESQTIWRYITIETLVGLSINAFMSVIFTWFVFHNYTRVPSMGGVSLVADAIPQSFMVALMSVLPVTLLTRARARKGRRLPASPGGWRGPRTLWLRGGLVAVITAAVGFVGFRLLAPPLAPDGVSFAHVLVLKAVYGAVLSAVIVPFAAIAALKDVA